MIITITLNPALDVSGTVPKLVPNEKTYVFDETRLPGGNGVNAARIAHRLGAEVVATGFLGGSSGEEFSFLLDGEGIPHHFIKIEGRTRSNVTVSLEKSHEQTRLSFPGPRIQKKEVNNFLYYLEHSHPSLVVVGGSLPSGVRPSLIKKIVMSFRPKGIPVFVDVPGKILKEIISSQPYFIKPNLTEFQDMLGKKMSSTANVLKEARKLSKHIPLICISSVEGGALLVTAEHAWFGKIPKVKVQSTVGAGDSMVGAMAHSFVQMKNKLDEKSCEKMLRLGLAASAATLVNKGLTMGSRKAMKDFLPLIFIRQID